MKKGFTLIELLAVIVILAIIALIVTPVISRIIDGAKKSAASQSAVSYVKAVDSTNQAALLGNNSLANRFEYNVDINSLGVEVSGNKPTNGYVNIVDNTVYSATLCIDNYVLAYKNNNAEIVSENGCNIRYLYGIGDPYDVNVGKKANPDDVVNPAWKRYVKNTYFDDTRISVELCSAVNGKTVCVLNNKKYALSDIAKENNGLFSTELCSNLSLEEIASLEADGLYKASGFTCTYDGEVYKYIYKERKATDNEHFTPARTINSTITKSYGGNKFAECYIETNYFTEKDIRSDILPYINMTVDEVDNLPTAEFNKVKAYFQAGDRGWSYAGETTLHTETSGYTNNTKYGLKSGSATVGGCRFQ